jgi:glycosyltransferase involved in cell wall biosynthesis
VLVDAVSARVGGGGTLIVSQLGALHDIPGIELTVHAVGGVADRLAQACPDAHIHREPRRSLMRRIVWEQSVLAARARGYDAVYLPGNFALLLARTPQVLTLQKASLFTDAHRAFRRRRYSVPGRARLALESAVSRASIRRATRVVAVSRSLADGIEADLGRLEHLRVIPSAPPELGAPGTDARWDPPLPESYVLVVSADHPHKDWDGLIEVFAASGDLPPLVIVGTCARDRARVLSRRIAALGAGKRVRLLGAVDDRSALAALYSGADCCLVHSYIEAVGLTGLEALSLGVPVAASDIPAHREVLGDAPMYYPPDDPEELAAAVRKALMSQPDHAQPTVPVTETWPANAAALTAVIHEAVRARSL